MLQRSKALLASAQATRDSVKGNLEEVCRNGDLKALHGLFATHAFILGQMSSGGETEEILFDGCMVRGADAPALSLLDAYFGGLGGSYILYQRKNPYCEDDMMHNVWKALSKVENKHWGPKKPSQEKSEADLDALIKVVSHLVEHHKFPILEKSMDKLTNIGWDMVTYTTLAVVRLNNGECVGNELDKFMERFVFRNGDNYNCVDTVCVMARALVAAMPSEIFQKSIETWMKRLEQELVEYPDDKFNFHELYPILAGRLHGFYIGAHGPSKRRKQE